MVQVEIDGLEYIEKLAQGDQQVRKAVYFAQKRALIAARQVIVKEVPKTYDVKAAAIRSGIDMDTKIGVLKFMGRPMKLIDFKVSPKTQSKKIVRASVKRAGGKISYAFVAQMSNDHTGVFRQVGYGKPNPPRSNKTGNIKIQELYSVSIPQMAGEYTILQSAMQRAQVVFKERFYHEVERLL